MSIVVGLYQFQRRKTKKDHVACVVQKQHKLRHFCDQDPNLFLQVIRKDIIIITIINITIIIIIMLYPRPHYLFPQIHTP